MFEKLKGYAWAAGCVVASVAVVGLAAWLMLVSAERNKLDKALTASRLEVSLCQTERLALRGEIDQQNGEVQRLRRLSDEKASEARKAREQAARDAAAYRRRIARLEAAEPGPDQCVGARDLIVGVLREDRR